MPDTITLADFITAQRAQAKNPNADIRSRWASRIVARGLHLQGLAGAEAYLRDYGRGISTSKVVAFAVMAEAEDCADMAVGFWTAAYTLATGIPPRRVEVELAESTAPAFAGAIGAIGTAQSLPAAAMRPTTITGLPAHLQPAAIVTMQPVDAAHDRDHYGSDPNYIGQPKRDGNRMVVIATADEVFYQSRSTSLQAMPDRNLDVALRQTAAERGTFILDGERLYLDAATGEHRTGAQAAQANADLGKPTASVVCQFSVFKALFADRLDLTTRSEVNRMAAAEPLVTALQQHLKRMAITGLQVQVELVPSAYSTADKRALCDKQQAEGREGEVWIRTNTPYLGGKAGGEAIVRTKYLTETNVVVTGLTPTTVAGRAFGAIEVAEMQPDGSLRLVGSVGTGFSQADARDLMQRFAAGRLVITVIHQGRTENGQLWHARFAGIIPN